MPVLHPVKKKSAAQSVFWRGWRKGRREAKGVVTLDGSMLDKPMELRARATIRKARAAGMMVEDTV